MPINIKEKQRRQGIILTDSHRLARLLKVSRAMVLAAIQKYIKNVESEISYSLLDTADTLDNDWRTYHKLIYKDKHFNLQNKAQYLFIIGGEYVIPVPSMQNCMPGAVKELVPTDILYGYNLTLFSAKEENINSLIKSRHFYHVGRLPLGNDSTFDILENYLERAATYMGKGIPVQMAYAQSDPHWKQVSMKVISDLNESQLLPNIQAPSTVLYDKIFLSPYITCETVDKAFNCYSNLYYFNMHGSSNPHTPQFLGQSIEEEERFFEGIDPQTLQKAKYDNIVVTEACYGGKYIGLNTNQSMLLSSMSSTTMLYLGSSVTAYGVIDKSLESGSDINSADIMAKDFISSLMAGYSAGEAMFKARRHLFNTKESGNIVANLLAIYEFSLYGDPALKAYFPNQQDANEIKHDSWIDDFNTTSLQIEEIYREDSSSILSLIRNKVDSNLKTLNEDIQKHLTSWGIKPKELTSVARVRYGLSSQHMFTYKCGNGIEPVVVVDDHTQTKTILMPKNTIEQNFDDAQNLSIDYETIFQAYCHRFGLISSGIAEQPIIEGNGSQIKTIYIDKRIEPKSKQQIKTFNAILNQVYRSEMRETNIATLGIKDCEYDFSVLINPLAIILETELRTGLIPMIKKLGTNPPTEATFGKMVECFFHNKKLLQNHGINDQFITWLGEVPQYRNRMAHSGGINEPKFIQFYNLFTKIVTSPSFNQVLEIKQNYK